MQNIEKIYNAEFKLFFLDQFQTKFSLKFALIAWNSIRCDSQPTLFHIMLLEYSKYSNYDGSGSGYKLPS